MATSTSAIRPAPKKLRSSAKLATKQRAAPAAVASLSRQDTDDEEAAAFVRRTLCAHQLRSASLDLHDLLPPLTSSNDVDVQLYALLAVIIREAVQSWYSLITPDHDFVQQVLHVVAHCTRALEQRIRTLDWEAILLAEVPTLINAHVTAYRTAKSTAGARRSLGVTSQGVYHFLRHHPALDPPPRPDDPESIERQTENEAAWRQLLVQGVLAYLLPPEDLANPCLRILVTEIFAEMIIGDAISAKICQGWFIWRVILNTLQSHSPSTDKVISDQVPTAATRTRLEAFGLVDPDAKDKANKALSTPTRFMNTVSGFVFQLVTIVAACFDYMQTVIRLLVQSKHMPHRATRPTKQLTPMVSMPAWSLPFKLLDLDTRMPWVTGTLSQLQLHLLHGPGKLGATNNRLDRLLSHYFTRLILTPARLPDLLRSARTALFPDNAMGAARAVPNADEVLAIKDQCAQVIVDVFPQQVRNVYFDGADSESSRAEVKELLDVFADVYMNKHLVFSIIDLAVCRLFPEMAQSGVEEILSDRGISSMS